MAQAVMSACGHGLNRVDTIQLTAHLGHGLRAGGTIADDDFKALLEGISRLDRWGDFAGVMTGYIASIGQLKATGQAIKTFRQHNPDAPILVDPVAGDDGRLYVDESLAQMMGRVLLTEAQIITPNAFELGYFSGLPIMNRNDVIKATTTLLKRYPNLEAIAVTGFSDHDSGVIDGFFTRDGGQYFSQALQKNQSKGMPQKGLPGGGDLFAAIMMAKKLDGLNWQDSTAEASRLSRLILKTTKGETDISLGDVVAQLTKDT